MVTDASAGAVGALGTMIDAEVLSERSVGYGAVRIERADQFRLVAESKEETWFYIDFMFVQIRDVWEHGKLERWAKCWDDGGWEHVLSDRGEQAFMYSDRQYMLKCSTPMATVKAAISGDVFNAAFEQPRELVEDDVIPA